MAAGSVKPSTCGIRPPVNVLSGCIFDRQLLRTGKPMARVDTLVSTG